MSLAPVWALGVAGGATIRLEEVRPLPLQRAFFLAVSEELQ